MSRVRLVAMFMLITAAVLLPVSDARADNKWGCPVVYVSQSEYQNGGAHQPVLQIQCSGDGNTYTAFTGGTPTCSTYVSLDTMKGWLSIVQASLLAKKPVDIVYTNVCGSRMMTAVALSGY